MSYGHFLKLQGIIQIIALCLLLEQTHSLQISVTKNPVAIVGNHSVDLKCTYNVNTHNGFTDVVTNIIWQKKQSHEYEQDDNIALFWPPNMHIKASFTHTGPRNSLKDRAELVNPSSATTSAILRLNLVTHEDEGEYRCVITYVGSTGQFTVFATTNLTVTDPAPSRCLSCVDRVQPRHCHYIASCQQGEECITEKFLTATGEILYNVGCKAKKTCKDYKFDPTHSNAQKESLISPDGRVSSLLCRECCEGDLCNSRGCGETDFPVDRGPICFNCMQGSNPSTCDVISVCGANEGCFLESEIEFGDILYKSHCLRKDLCKYGLTSPSLVGRRSVSGQHSDCKMCCFSDLCNDHCNTNTTISPTTELPTKSSTTTTTSTTTMTTAKPVSRSHEGRRFLLMFLANYNWAENITLVITTQSSSETHITLTSGFPNVSRSVSFYGKSIQISLPKLLPALGSNIENKAVLLVSSNPVSVYGFNFFKCCAIEGFAAIPSENFGTLYKVVTYTPGNRRGLIGITTEYSNTRVMITFNSSREITYNGQVYRSGDHLIITLTALETFQFGFEADLTGTTIQSSLPVAVLSGNDCVAVLEYTCNHLVEFMMPVSNWGKTTIVPSLKNGIKMILVIVPSQPNTSITLPGGNTKQTSDKVELVLDATSSYLVQCDKPCLVIQYILGNSNQRHSFMTTVPSIENFSSNYVIATSPSTSYINFTTSNFAAVIISSNHLSGLRYDGAELYSVNHVSNSLAHNGQYWSIVTIDVTMGTHEITHIIPNIRFGVMQYGMSDGNKGNYGFPSGLNLN